MSMSTVYTIGGPQVGMAIAQPAETPQREVGGGGVDVWTEKWGWADELKKASIHFQFVCVFMYACMFLNSI